MAREQYRDAKLAIVDEAKTADGRKDWRAAAWALAKAFPEDYGRSAAPARPCVAGGRFAGPGGVAKDGRADARRVRCADRGERSAAHATQKFAAVRACRRKPKAPRMKNVTIRPEIQRRSASTMRVGGIGHRERLKNVTIRPEFQQRGPWSMRVGGTGHHERLKNGTIRPEIPRRASSTIRVGGIGHRERLKNVTIRPEIPRRALSMIRVGGNGNRERLKNVTIRPEIQRRGPRRLPFAWAWDSLSLRRAQARRQDRVLIWPAARNLRKDRQLPPKIPYQSVRKVSKVGWGAPEFRHERWHACRHALVFGAFSGGVRFAEATEPAEGPAAEGGAGEPATSSHPFGMGSLRRLPRPHRAATASSVASARTASPSSSASSGMVSGGAILTVWPQAPTGAKKRRPL